MNSEYPSEKGMESEDIDASASNDTKQVVKDLNSTKKVVEPKMAKGCSAAWSRQVHKFRRPVVRFMQAISGPAAHNPKRTISLVSLLTIGVFTIGIFTNFRVESDSDVLWAPKEAISVQHNSWIEDESGFPKTPRYFSLFFHQDGDSVIGLDQVQRVFTALDTVRNLNNYNQVCSESRSGSCQIHGIVEFWNKSSAVYEAQVQSYDDLVRAISKKTYPDGRLVSEGTIFGLPQRNSSGYIIFAQSYSVDIELPDTTSAESFETDALDAILDLNDEWSTGKSTAFRVEVFAGRSFSDEFERAVVKDLPLVPIVFIIMGIFTSLIFLKRDRVKSRSLLGFTAVVSVLLSLLTGYGLMFACGIPLTSITQILPFIIFGVGLDDAFVIIGAYERTDVNTSPAERIHATMEDIGLSIFLTTLTSTIAFGTGCLSAIPAVYWLCLYAFPTITIVLLYQVTFFVACIVLDERRIEHRRRDCCICMQVPVLGGEGAQGPADDTSDQRSHFVDRLMKCYAEYLLRPSVRVVVFICFSVLFAVCAVSASKLEQSFKFTDVLPQDSYVTAFFNAHDIYTQQSEITPGLYFRWVDQSDPSIQQQMEAYVKDMVLIKQISKQPDYFWLRDFQSFINGTNGLSNLTFAEQVDAFLAVESFHTLYNDDIVRDQAGHVTASRCFIEMDNLDIDDVKEQIDALHDQVQVADRQPINNGRDDYVFFSYEENYSTWEFYAASVRELKSNTLYSVVAVTFVAFIFIPHWTAAVYVFPLVCILYIDILGVLQWAGVTINAVSYVTMVMCVGLLVDYLLHPLIRYYDSECLTRHEKTVDVLETMGASILIGAVSTFLGIVPLAFSSSEIFSTVFYTFLGLVTLGASHGLIVLPVLLATFGTEERIHEAKGSQPDSSLNQTERGSEVVDVEKEAGLEEETCEM